MTESTRAIFEKSYPAGIRWNIEIPQRPLYEILDKAVAAWPQSELLDFMGKTMTFSDVHRGANKVAAGLQKMGIGKGDKVGLFLPNCPYFVMCYFGILKAGATVVNYNPLYAARELAHQVKDSGTRTMITLDLNVLYPKAAGLLGADGLERIIVCPMKDILPFPKNILFPIVKRKEIADIPSDARHMTFAALSDNDGHFTPPAVDSGNDVAVLQYTGGTTGVPKGAMLTHANLYANVSQVSAWLKTAKAGVDSQVGVIPFFHVFAMTAVMNLSIIKGLKIYLQPRFELDAVLKLIKKHKPSYFLGVPAIFNAIANYKDIEQYDFSSFKYCLAGGAPLPVDVKRLFEQRTKCKVLGEGYGLTETSPVVCVNPVGDGVRAGSIGLPLPLTDVMFVDVEDRRTPVALGEKGELCVKGPQVMKGYHENAEATAETIIDGWLHTGDVGYMDEDGYVHLVDRIKDLIIVRGYNVYPRNVEEAIQQHDAVDEVIVAGVPDAERGETVHAWVKPADGKNLTEKDLMAFLEDKLSPIEMPRKIIIRTKPLPKTTVGKLSRKDLLIEEGITK